LPVRVVCDPLSVDDLEAVMQQSEGSILRQYQKDFAGYGIEVSFSPAAIRCVAESAHKEKTGARGLMTVLERALRDFKFALPSTTIRQLTVTEQTIRQPQACLEEMLQEAGDPRRADLEQELEAFLVAFARDHGITLQVSQPVAGKLLDACLAANQSLTQYWAAHFADMEYGFRLLAGNTGKQKFRLTKRFIENPGQTLSDWVARSFQKG